MASFTLSRPDLFPSGTTVAAHPASQRRSGAAPDGAATSSASAGASSVALTGLADGTAYVAYALVSSEHRYLGFRTPPAATSAPVWVGTAADYGLLTPVDGTVYVVLP